jgi:hypothetical protein
MFTEVNMPRRMPALDILPLEQSRKRFQISETNPGTGQLNFLLSEDPESG